MANPIISEHLIVRALDLFERFVDVLSDINTTMVVQTDIEERRLAFEERRDVRIAEIAYRRYPPKKDDENGMVGGSIQ